jgi:hypothetical protein
MCCAIFILYNWVCASLNRMKSTQSLTNFVSSIVVFPERSRGRFRGNARYLDALQKLTSRAKSPFCAINMSNHLNVGFRILWCELWCVRLDVLVEKRTRPNMQRVLGTFFQFSQNQKKRDWERSRDDADDEQRRFFFSFAFFLTLLSYTPSFKKILTLLSSLQKSATTDDK